MLRKTALALAALLAAVVAGELAYRAFSPRADELAERVADLREYLDGGQRFFAPNPYTGFVLAAGDHDSPAPHPLGWGFRREKTPGVPRIACLGASTTQEGYPEELQLVLLEEGRLAEVMNWGVSGWTSMETMINWFVNVQDHDPDVVVVHLGGNDVAPRKVAGFRPDYAHFRRPWSEPRLSRWSRALCRISDFWAGRVVEGHGFALADFVNRRGVLAADRRADPGGDLTPDTAQPFRRNIATICEHALATGRTPILVTMPSQPDPASPDRQRAEEGLMLQGLREHNAILRELAEELGLLLVDAAAACEADPERWSATFTDLVHQTREGRRLKARLVADALQAVELPPVPPELSSTLRNDR